MTPFLVIGLFWVFLAVYLRVLWQPLPALDEATVRANGAPLSHAVEVTDR